MVELAVRRIRPASEERKGGTWSRFLRLCHCRNDGRPLGNAYVEPWYLPLELTVDVRVRDE